MREELNTPIHSAASESSYRGRIPQKVLRQSPGYRQLHYFPGHDDCPAQRCRTFWRAAQMSVAAQIGFYVATTLNRLPLHPLHLAWILECGDLSPLGI